MLVTPHVYERLISVEMLPPMSATASRLLAMATDPDVDLDLLATSISQDPPLTAKVLSVANSAYYAPPQPVLTVKQAIVQVLGLRMVGNLAFGIALNGAMSNAECPNFDPTRYWIVALGTAELASGLARATTVTERPDPDAAYLVGLLHNLGELLLVHLWPREMNELLAQFAERSECDVAELERQLLGIDRWAAGAMLARHWQLPDVVADSIEQLALVKSDPPDAPLMHLLGAARCWIEGVASGRSDALSVVGVDEAYCEYRSATLRDHYDALKSLAAALHA